MGGCVFAALGGQVGGTWRGYGNGKGGWSKYIALYLTKGPLAGGSVLGCSGLDRPHSTKKQQPRVAQFIPRGS